MAVSRLTDEKLEEILEEFWNFTSSNKAAEAVGVAQSMVSLIYGERILREYYNSEPLPEILPIDTVFASNRQPLTFGEIEKNIKKMHKTPVSTHALTKQLNLLTDLGYYRKKIINGETVYLRQRHPNIFKPLT